MCAQLPKTMFFHFSELQFQLDLWHICCLKHLSRARHFFEAQILLHFLQADVASFLSCLFLLKSSNYSSFFIPFILEFFTPTRSFVRLCEFRRILKQKAQLIFSWRTKYDSVFFDRTAKIYLKDKNDTYGKFRRN